MQQTYTWNLQITHQVSPALWLHMLLCVTKPGQRNWESTKVKQQPTVPSTSDPQQKSQKYSIPAAPSATTATQGFSFLRGEQRKWTLLFPMWPQFAFAQIPFFLSILPIDCPLFHSECQVHSSNVLLQLIWTEPKHSIELQDPKYLRILLKTFLSQFPETPKGTHWHPLTCMPEASFGIEQYLKICSLAQKVYATQVKNCCNSTQLHIVFSLK